MLNTYLEYTVFHITNFHSFSALVVLFCFIGHQCFKSVKTEQSRELNNPISENCVYLVFAYIFKPQAGQSCI